MGGGKPSKPTPPHSSTIRSSSFFLTSPDRVAIIVAGPASPARSGGGLKRGAPRLRPARRLSFHRRSASPARSGGGLKRGAPRLRPARRLSFHQRSASPARSGGGLKRGAPRLRPARRGSLDSPAQPRQTRQRQGEPVGHGRARPRPREPAQPARPALHLLL